jgi:hypothetical protein
MKILILLLSFCLAQGLSAQTIKYVVAKSGVNMRTTPDKTGGKVQSIAYGEEVKVVDNKSYKSEVLENKKGSWRKCSYKGKTGFIFDAFLADTKPGAEPKQPTTKDKDPKAAGKDKDPKAVGKDKDPKTAPGKETNQGVAPAPKHEAKMAAFLIYDDATYSSFDIINDKDVYLWNTNIGEGSAEKPSIKTFLRVQCSASLLNQPVDIVVEDMTIKKTLYNKKHQGLKDPIDITINGTGCGVLQIKVLHNNAVLASKKLDFKCGTK